MGFDYQHPDAGQSTEDLNSPSSTLEDACDNIRQRPSPRRSAWSVILYWASRLALLVWLLVVFAASCVVLESLRDSLGRRLSLIQDPTGNIPHFPILPREIKLEANKYTLDPDNSTMVDVKKVEKLWSALLPVGQGFLSPKHRLDELPEISSDPAGNPAYPVAVFHELHCLYMVMAGYNGLAMGQKEEHPHMRHCFDYLRQAIMCHADTTIEGKFDVTVGDLSEDAEEPPQARFATHVCKDYSAVVKWANDHRTNEYVGIVNAHRPGHEKSHHDG